ncbi:hypothetical protein M9X92_011190 [Pyricularia oryzae]|nr:hypothetical protein M9X92_011190 [Pyricularia oryzae]
MAISKPTMTVSTTRMQTPRVPGAGSGPPLNTRCTAAIRGRCGETGRGLITTGRSGRQTAPNAANSSRQSGPPAPRASRTHFTPRDTDRPGPNPVRHDPPLPSLFSPCVNKEDRTRAEIPLGRLLTAG